jgi:hypothetical protein
MTTPMLIQWSLTSAALCISIYAAFAASRTSGRSLSKRLSELSTRLEELDEGHQLLAAELNRVRSRANMDKLRRKREATAAAENGEPSGSGSTNGATETETAKDEWTRQTNLKIARGEIHPLGRR